MQVPSFIECAHLCSYFSRIAFKSIQFNVLMIYMPCVFEWKSKAIISIIHFCCSPRVYISGKQLTVKQIKTYKWNWEMAPLYVLNLVIAVCLCRLCIEALCIVMPLKSEFNDFETAFKRICTHYGSSVMNVKEQVNMNFIHLNDMFSVGFRHSLLVSV